MKRFIPVLLAFLIGISCSHKKYDNIPTEFIQIKNDSLVIYSTSPDSVSEIFSSVHFTHYWNGNPNPVPDSLIMEAEKFEQVINRISFDLGWKFPDKNYNVNWYPSPELKTIKSGSSEFDSKKENVTFHVFNSDLPAPSMEPEIELVFKDQLDKIRNKKLKKAFAGYLGTKPGKEQSIPSFFRFEPLPELSEISNPNTSWQQESQLSTVALIYLFSLFQDKGKLFISLTSVSENGQSISPELIDFWNTVKPDLKKNENGKSEGIQIRGFNFTHEGYRIYNGYLSESAKKSLMQLKKSHSNSIALVPFGFMSSESEPTIFWANQTGSENDESIIYSGINAKKIGLQVMIKPQIWLRHGIWCGDIEMQNENDWLKFQNEYKIWILHYAAIAQQYQFEFLSLGVELLKFTKNRPDFFISLISEIRKIYDGQITYSANWYDEADRIHFWDKLDFIGINSYYPLSEKENADEQELRRTSEKLGEHFSDLSVKWNRKIVFTEIGFAKNKSPWIMPHDEKNNSHYSETEQALCCKIISDGWLNQDWCGGLLWWKWASSLEVMEEDRINFFPGQRAQAIVSERFAK